jgi:anti-sigma-K factor RskA
MNEHEPMTGLTLDCAAVDELTGALTLGALEPDEARAVTVHLATCPQPHDELWALLGAGAALAASIEPVEPSPGLRRRLMETLAAVPQDVADVTEGRSAPAVAPARDAVPSAPSVRPWWRSLFDPRSVGFARGLAAVALVGVIVLGAVNLSLRSSLDDRQAALDRVASVLASAGPAFAVKATPEAPGAGSGYVIDHNGQPVLVAAVPPAPAGHIYEMWLLDAAGKPVSAGTFVTKDQIVVVALQAQLAGYTTFAVTIESHRVDQPTTKPIIVGAIGT